MENFYKWDVFISHASEDKRFANKIAELLVEMGLKVWYDSLILNIGDSLTKKINEGLAQSEFGIVIMSPSFFRKDWTQLEIASLLNREINNKKVILPIWYGITKEEIIQISPLFVDKLAANTKFDSVEKICTNILKVIKPASFSEVDYIPIEYKAKDNTQMVVLPVRPSNGKTIALGKHPITNKQYDEYLINITKSEKKHITNLLFKVLSKQIELRGEVENIFSKPIGEKFIDESWEGPFDIWNDIYFNSPDKPVVCISLLQAIGYTIWLSLQNPKTDTSKWYYDGKFVLPTPKIWDFAAFGKLFPAFKPSNWLNRTQSIHHNSTSTSSVYDSELRTNSWGLSDMFGNVWEWCHPSNINFDEQIGKIIGLDIVSKLAIIGHGRFPSNYLSTSEIRGGGYLDDLSRISPFISSRMLKDGLKTRHADLGFRIAQIVELSEINHQNRLWKFETEAKEFLVDYF